jgi:hypothetical protein
MTKGLDASFVHFGIRQSDMGLLEALAKKHQLDWDWLQEEVLKKFHEQKSRDQELDESALFKIIDKALNKLGAN